MVNEVLLKFEAVGAAYNGAIVALHRVDLEIRAGEFVALLGSNGAGKTTLLKAASNLLPAERGAVTAGAIRYLDRDVTKVSPADLVRSGLVQVLEGRHCFRSLTVEENLAAGAIAAGASRGSTRAGLDRVFTLFPRLAEKRHVTSGLTSGGEQQMTAIGRGLMSAPRLLILDEPSMGLAPLVVQEIFAAMRGLNAEGLSILVAEQNLVVALAHADRATVIENGWSVLSGPATELAARDDIHEYYLGGAATARAAGSSSRSSRA
ncbi:MAG: ABC transporter ATP-binding protein [Amaricoccus sp.]